MLTVCAKFMAMQSWAGMVSQPLATKDPLADEDDSLLVYRVTNSVPVIIWDREQRRRRILKCRWGFPIAKDLRRLQLLHAHIETIETSRTFARAFHDGQRGIVLARTFNGAHDVQIFTTQTMVTERTSKALGATFIWRRFDIRGAPPLYACALVTLPADPQTAIIPTDRMPAILKPEDWSTWLGEMPATADLVMACLKTVDHVA